MCTRIVVAGALISGSAVLVAQRQRPPELAGLWELPGGKVAAGETDAAALVRELREGLICPVLIGSALGANGVLRLMKALRHEVLERIGGDVEIGGGLTLRAYQVVQTGGSLHPHDHRALRWVGAADLDALAWVPADRQWLGALSARLTGAG